MLFFHFHHSAVLLCLQRLTFFPPLTEVRNHVGSDFPLRRTPPPPPPPSAITTKYENFSCVGTREQRSFRFCAVEQILFEDEEIHQTQCEMQSILLVILQSLMYKVMMNCLAVSPYIASPPLHLLSPLCSPVPILDMYRIYPSIPPAELPAHIRGRTSTVGRCQGDQPPGVQRYWGEDR